MVQTIEYKLDKVRNIKLDNRAIDRFEAKTGKIFMVLDLSKMPIGIMQSIVWAGLVHEDPELSYEKLVDLVDEFSNITELYSKTLEAALTTLPKMPETKPGDAERVNKAGKNVKRA